MPGSAVVLLVGVAFLVMRLLSLVSMLVIFAACLSHCVGQLLVALSSTPGVARPGHGAPRRRLEKAPSLGTASNDQGR
jgi:hypothetical protein